MRTRHLYRWFSTCFRGVSRGVQLCRPVVGYSSTLTQERQHTAKILQQDVSLSPVAKPGDTVVASVRWTKTTYHLHSYTLLTIQTRFLLRSDKPLSGSWYWVSENVTTLKTYFAQTSMRSQFFFKQSSLPLYKLCNESWTSGWRSERDEIETNMLAKTNVEIKCQTWFHEFLADLLQTKGISLM